MNGAASHGGKTEGHMPLSSKLWRQDTGPCALGSKSWRQDTGPGALGGKLWRQDTGPRALGSKSWRQDTGPCALGGTGLCALGSKSQDNGSGRPQVMVARSHTRGSKFRKATSQVHEPSRQQVRVVGHRFSCPGWH